MYREAREMDPNVISTLCSNLQPYNHIRAELFSRYGVKRGLRNGGRHRACSPASPA